MKTCNLHSLIKNINNDSLYENYIQILTGNQNYRLKSKELNDIKSLLDITGIDYHLAYDFYYSYNIPQIGKEFDLLKIYNDLILNIELKSEYDFEDIKKQLILNDYYLSTLNDKTIKIISFCSETNKFYIVENQDLIELNLDIVKQLLNYNHPVYDGDIDTLFLPSKYLVSPLNDTEKFLENNYYLTPQQENIKKEIIDQCINDRKFMIINGKAGTGKTLLLYDIARALAVQYNVCVIHCGIVCRGHSILNENIENLTIYPIAQVGKIIDRQFDIIFVDEYYRIWENSFGCILNYCDEQKISCIVFGDKRQTLSLAEETRNLDKLLINRGFQISKIFKLSKEFRINKSLNNFIRLLFNLNEPKKFEFNNVTVLFANDYDEFEEVRRSYCRNHYQYINYTPSRFIVSRMNFEEGIYLNTHEVIGQEFDNVILYIDENFYYDDNGKLCAKKHPNPNYLFCKLLYQGLTRARMKLVVVIINNISLLEKIMIIMNKDVTKS